MKIFNLNPLLFLLEPILLAERIVKKRANLCDSLAKFDYKIYSPTITDLFHLETGVVGSGVEACAELKAVDRKPHLLPGCPNYSD